MRFVPVVLRAGAAFGVVSVTTGAAFASDPTVISPGYIYATTVLAAVMVGTAAFIAWVEKKIDTRVTERIGPVERQVAALYNHFLGPKDS